MEKLNNIISYKKYIQFPNDFRSVQWIQKILRVIFNFIALDIMELYDAKYTI